MFNRRKELMQVWNSIYLIKWWNNFPFWLNSIFDTGRNGKLQMRSCSYHNYLPSVRWNRESFWNLLGPLFPHNSIGYRGDENEGRKCANRETLLPDENNIYRPVNQALTLCHAMEKACYLTLVLTNIRPLRGVWEKDERGSEELLFFHACLC